MIKMVVFDMAGTTVDEDNVVYKTLHEAVSRFGFDCSFETVLAHCAGKEKKQAIIELLNYLAADLASVDEIYALFVELLQRAYQDLKVRPMPGAQEIFDYLRNSNIKVVLNTGYNQLTAESLLKKLGWEVGRDIDALVTASLVTAARPEPDMIVLAQHQFGIESGSEIIKVGDSIIDIEEGRNAGCKFCIGVTTGAHTHEQLQTANPDYIIERLFELENIIVRV